MEELITGLNVLLQYVLPIKRMNVLRASDNVIVVSATARKMTFQHVQLLTRLGWYQDKPSQPKAGADYDVAKPWSYNVS